MKRLDPEAYKRWRIIQAINYGGEKISEKKVKELWPKIKNDLDIDARKALEFLLWGKRWKAEPGLRPDRSNFWNWYRKIKISELNSISLEKLLHRYSLNWN